ncbi:hypothetical protein QFC22_000189 [Naganishia vaughanmartiniae]|uniref:Uncharacterized protein n=1 Tax=Naganishia vaughanmartiniae TaxID=1424756 RepID=A0ACC2XPE0_9TREE|nr:hypothetical protein QFC22_000189 [Naganishia vaughanmartiniae]
MAELTVFATTYNLNTRGASLAPSHLQHWLHPAFQGDSAGTTNAPDLVVIGVQELIPLHESLSGFGATFIANFQHAIVTALNTLAASLFPAQPASFRSVAPGPDYKSTSIGSIILLVFHNTQTVPVRKLGRPAIACLGLGLGSTYGLDFWSEDRGGYGMGNKGAVGLRIPINRGTEEEEFWETFTFIGAHLAAHDKNLAERNANYRQILSSMLFTPSSSLDRPLRVWQTSHIVFVGDLNYRLAASPSGLEMALKDSSLYEQPNQQERNSGDMSALARERQKLVALDTLKQQQAQGKAFTFLGEGDLKTFAPTYKRIIGQVDGYNKKRRPGYTDRILFASYRAPRGSLDDFSDVSTERSPLLDGAEEQDSSETVQIEKYDSIPDLTVSDHKPVYALIKIPTPATDSQHRYASQHTTPFLPFASVMSPPPTDALSLGARRAISQVVDRTVGLTWYATLMLGAGNLIAGLLVEGLLVIVALTWWMGLW